jgi:hypothetical protein
MKSFQGLKNLISKYDSANSGNNQNLGSPAIHVDEVASKVASFYEQIRTVVEWKEEHLMLRAAIIRKLKRKFFDLQMSDFSNQPEAAESLILELIRGGHFPNDKIQESKISDVQKIIDRYIFILKNSSSEINFSNWLIEVASCEIEDTLHPATKENALTDFMFEVMKKRIKVSDKIFESGLLKKEDVDTQIYIAVQQSLFKFDKPMISYNLIKYKYSNWENAVGIWKNIEIDLTNKISGKFYTICEKHDTPFLLLGDVLMQENGSSKILEPEDFEGAIRSAYAKRLSTLKKRIRRAAVYSTISIFVTKIISLIALMLILEKFIPTEHQNIIMIIADVLIPTFLMFLIVSSVKKPPRENLNMVIMETMKIVYEEKDTDIYEIKLRRKKGLVTRIAISLVYAASTLASFGAIYFGFHYFGFPISSIVINMIFIALILFTGTVITKRAQELTIGDEKEDFITFLADIFFLPLQGLGKWLSTKWKKYNAIAAIFNALIDMPFSAFVEFIEKWRYFIKESKEDIR